MTWLLIAYLVGLFYLAVNNKKIANIGAFRAAWISYSLIPLSHFIFTLLRVGNFGQPRDLALIEIWANGIPWLLLAISLFCLLGALVPAEPTQTNQ